MPNFPELKLNERSQHLLKVLIESYIQEGSPIASATLLAKSGLSVSPATIRHAMAGLEKMGLVKSPHTSSGRVPTSQGYRVFVDSLVSVQALDEKTLTRLQISMNAEETASGLLQKASGLLSGITQLAGLVTMPHRSSVGIRHIEFVNLTEKQVLTVLVLQDGEIQNRLLKTERSYATTELQAASNYLNSMLEGQTLQQAKRSVLREMAQVRHHMNRMMQAVMELGSQTLDHVDSVMPEDDLLVAGEKNLMNYEDLADMNKLKGLFQAFEEKQEMLALLNTTMDAEGVQIFIGRESGYQVFDDCSMVTSTYRAEDGSIGVLGVVGPRRISYERIIPVVDITARLLSASFKTNR
jgi:heat-inducible transcriptional repressor